MENTKECNALQGKKVVINYPTRWKYKVIGKNSEIILRALKDILQNKTYSTKHSKTSSTKKYISIEAEILVLNEEERLSIFEILKMHSSIDYVL